jgi:tetratricopeptide (TPR) repeat protein
VVSRLRHPHIAQLVDGGEGEQGELWYAMELVEGQDLLKHCAQRRLDLRARVGLLLDLCDAVAYAHRNLILHRDIKPSNVLVDREGQLKLIDFGIAKGLDEGNEGLTQDQAPMTPRYAAPEQLRGERPTTATDLWQIAAVGFELLAGAPARKDGQLRRLSHATAEGGTEHAASCGLDPQRLQKALRGDLDAILSKALREESEERYANVESLSNDLRAWLQGLPVAVRRHERWYAARRFVSVHRWAVGFAGLTALSMTAMVIGTTLMASKAAREAEGAQRAVDSLARVLLSRGDSPNLLTMSVRDLIETQVKEVVNADQIPPKHRIRLLSDVSKRAAEVGAVDTAILAATKAVELERLDPENSSPDVAVWMDNLALSVLVNVKDGDRIRKAAEILEESATTHRLFLPIGATRTMIHARAQAMLRQMRDGPREAIEYIYDNPSAQEFLNPPEESTLRSSESEAFQLSPINRTNFFWWISRLHFELGDLEKALEIARHAQEILTLAPAEDPSTKTHKLLLDTDACVYASLAGVESAEEVCQDAISNANKQNVAKSHLAGVHFGIGWTQYKREDLSAAISSYRLGIEYALESERQGVPATYKSDLDRELGIALLEMGKPSEAIEPLRSSMSTYSIDYMSRTWMSLRARVALADALTLSSLREEAISLLDPTLKPDTQDLQSLRRWNEALDSADKDRN